MIDRWTSDGVGVTFTPAKRIEAGDKFKDKLFGGMITISNVSGGFVYYDVELNGKVNHECNLIDEVIEEFCNEDDYIRLSGV